MTQAFWLVLLIISGIVLIMRLAWLQWGQPSERSSKLD